MSSHPEGWYVVEAGRTRGPLSRNDLLAMRDAGKLSGEALVWNLELSEWLPLHKALPVQGVKPPAGFNAEATPAPRQRKPEPQSAQTAASAQRARSEARPAAPLASAQQLPPPVLQAIAALGTRHPGREPETAEKIQVQNQAQLQRLGWGMRRLLARSIDLAVLGGLSWALLGLLIPVLMEKLLQEQYFPPLFTQAFAEYSFGAVLALGLLVLPLEALLTALGGYTPGKALLGLRVRSRNDRGIGLSRACRRAGQVYLRGQALLIPPFSLFANGVALRQLMVNGQTGWDDRLHTQIHVTPLSTQRWWAAIAALGIGWFMLFDNFYSKLVWKVADEVRRVVG